MFSSDQLKGFFKTLGPGILFAGTAIGVSHLVQSTRAGADYGFMLLWAVILANLFKYPFFEFGSRYANLTGTSIIDGYKRMGKWVLWGYFLITLVSMFFVTAAVGFVTAGFLESLFQLQLSDSGKLMLQGGIFLGVGGLLFIGRYAVLDLILKVFGSTLLISTLAAFFIVLFRGPAPMAPDFVPPDLWSGESVVFLIALMGWMPTAVDLSAWNSLWTLGRIEQTGFKPTLKQTLLDFNIGYIVSAALAICFLTLGAYLMYGTGEVLPKSNMAFSGKVVSFYTQSIGSWSAVLIGSAAFSIMLSTTIGVFDGYSRSMERITHLLFFPDADSNKSYSVWLIIVGVGGFGIIALFKSQLIALITVATTISFLIAPAVATANYMLVTKKYVPEDGVPPLWLRILSYGGIAFLTGFSILYIIVQFF